jgi:hypothetical protein
MRNYRKSNTKLRKWKPLQNKKKLNKQWKIFQIEKSVQKQVNQPNEQLPKKQYRAKKMKSIAKQNEIE